MWEITVARWQNQPVVKAEKAVFTVWCRHESGTDAATVGSGLIGDQTVAEARRRRFRGGSVGEESYAPGRWGMSGGVVGVAWYRLRTTFRYRWGGYVPLVLLIGLVGGVGMGDLAGVSAHPVVIPHGRGVHVGVLFTAAPLDRSGARLALSSGPH